MNVYTRAACGGQILGIFREKSEATQSLGCFTSDIWIWSTYALLRSSMREVLALMMSAICLEYSQMTFPYPRHWIIL